MRPDPAPRSPSSVSALRALLSPSRIPWWAVGLLLAEVLWLLTRFRTDTLRDLPEGWAQWMSRAKSLPQIALALGTAVLLFQRADGPGEAPRARPRARSAGQLAALVAAQLACFALLFRSSAGIFEERLEGVQHPLLALLVWALLAAAVVFLGSLLFVPLATLVRTASKRAGFLLGAAFLGVVAWRVGQYAMVELSQPLRGPTLWLCSRLLGLFESEAFVDVERFQFGTPECTVEIAPECSGFEGMGLMAVFACAYVWIFRAQLRFPQTFFLPLAGVVCVWLLNVVRIVALVWVGTHVSRDLAEGGFHSLAGTFAFCLAALALVALSRRMRFFTPEPRGGVLTGERDATLGYLAPFLLTVAFGMVISAFGTSALALEYCKPAAALGTVWLFRREHKLALAGISLPALLFGVLAGVVWIALPGDAPRPDSGLQITFRILSFVAIVPVVEELAFRGYLMRRLCSGEFESVDPRTVPVAGWAISSLLFGVLHGHWIAATLAGAAYAFAYMRRGRLFDAVLAHAATNLLLVGWAAWREDWSLI